MKPIPRLFLIFVLSTLQSTMRGQIYVSDGHAVGEYDATTGAAINSQLIGAFDSYITQFNEYSIFQPGRMVVVGSNLIVVGSTPYSIGEYDAATGATINDTLIGGYLGGTQLAAFGSNLFVSSGGLIAILKYTLANGKFTGLPSEFITPVVDVAGLTISGSDLFELDNASNNGQYREYDAVTGNQIHSSIITGLSSPTSIALSGSHLFVRNEGGFSGGSISEYTTSGSLVNPSLITGLSSYGDIAVSGSNLYVTNGPDVGLYTTDGSLVDANFIVTPNLGDPLYLAINNPSVSNSSVPDTGTTATMLGMSIVGLATLRRWRSKKAALPEPA